MNEKKYRKIPVVIEAIQLTEDNIREVYLFMHPKYHFGLNSAISRDKWGDYCDIVRKDGMSMFTLESGKGTQIASIGDFIIKGVQGEFYPCKPDVFKLTYEEVK